MQSSPGHDGPGAHILRSFMMMAAGLGDAGDSSPKMEGVMNSVTYKE